MTVHRSGADQTPGLIFMAVNPVRNFTPILRTVKLFPVNHQEPMSVLTPTEEKDGFARMSPLSLHLAPIPNDGYACCQARHWALPDSRAVAQNAQICPRGQATMKKRIHFSVLIAISLAVGVIPIARAQDQPYRLSDSDMKRLVAKTEKDADRFKDSLHKELEHEHWQDRRDRDDMNRAAAGFEHATDQLKDHFHHGNARASDVQEVLSRGAEIDSFIVGRHMLPRAHGDWMALRGDLDELAGAYHISWNWSENEHH
jgi:hypothetical protein